MILPIHPDSDRLARRHPAIPHDVKKAIEFMRQAVCRPISMAELIQHCGVAERTLNNHFRTFLNISPIRYQHRLRLAAARESLLAGGPSISITAVAKRYGFTHFGRFAGQYRRHFGESPSATLRNGRAATLSGPTVGHGRNTVARGGTGQELRLSLASRDRPSIAVLPCQASANEPALRWLAESVAEAIAAALCAVRSLAVMLPPLHRGPIYDPQRVARELNARYFLTGRIVRAGARLRFIVRVADSGTGHHVWGDSFDGEYEQPVDFQDRVVASIVRAILPSIRGAEIDRARRTPPQNLDAYGLAVRALPFVFASQPEASRRALELLHRAIEMDPDYGLATALAAWGHGQLVMYNGTPAPAEERSRALQLVQRAAILDDGDPLVLAARCAVHTMAREFDVAEALVARALALDPSSGWAWGRSGWLHSYQGHSETAIEHFGRALSLDPNPASKANSFIGIGSAHFNAGRYEAAASWLRSALLEQPGTSWPNRSLSVSYARLGDRLKALDSLDALRRSCPDLTVSQVVAAVPFRPDFLDRLGDGLSGLGLPP
jgi:TolB-like protein